MALFLKLAELAEQLASEAGRLKKRAAIAEAIAAVHAVAPESEDAGLFALYLAGTPFAEADSRKLNAGGALLSKALLAVSGATHAELTAAYRRHGDLGAAAFDLLERTRSGSGAGLTLEEMATAFVGMAVAGTTAIRARLVEELLRRATPLEAKYLLKLMLGDMRIGVKQSLVEEAIAMAASVPVEEVRHAVMLEADLAAAVKRAFAGTLAEARMRLFHPLGFMLASPVASPEEAVERFTEKGVESVEAFLEDKYDGMRAQVHCGNPEQAGRVTIFSRNREEVTASFPELEEAFASVQQPLIFDGEILGWDFATARALPFAVLAQRIGRKRVPNEVRQQIPVVFMAFDLMYAEGELLLELPLRERRNRLEAAVERLVEAARSPLTIDERRRGAQGVMFAEP
ncbi:MAG TPA: ATP-dependent DNA ligase, partial [Edaphobacter sp.]|nr:ATP-dependent DNA ligase [Edaphobacter sp.]